MSYSISLLVQGAGSERIKVVRAERAEVHAEGGLLER